jgi:hypothetical protein
MGKLLDLTYRWFFEPIDGRAVFFARAGFGAVLFWAYARLGPHVATLYGPHGIGGYDTLSAFPGFGGLAFQAFAQFRLLHRVSSESVVWGLYGALLVAAACFAVGYLTRLTGAVALALHVLFNAHNPHASWGWAWMIIPFSLYVLLSDPGRAYSVDAWLKARSGKLPSIAERVRIRPWAFRFLQLHVCTMYLTAGWERLDAPGWTQGEMVYRAVANDLFGRFDWDWFALRPVLTAATYGAYVLEPAAPLLLWLPRVGPIWVVALAAMHLGLELFCDVGWWQYTMMTGLLAFAPTRWFDAIGRWLGPSAPSPRTRRPARRSKLVRSKETSAASGS